MASLARCRIHSTFQMFYWPHLLTHGVSLGYVYLYIWSDRLLMCFNHNLLFSFEIDLKFFTIERRYISNNPMNRTRFQNNSLYFKIVAYHRSYWKCSVNLIHFPVNIRFFYCKTDLSFITKVFDSFLKKKCSLEIKTELFLILYKVYCTCLSEFILKSLQHQGKFSMNYSHLMRESHTMVTLWSVHWEQDY